MSGHLVEIRRPGEPPRRVEVAGSLEVGRHAAQGVAVPDRSLSRRHLALRSTGAELTVRDLGSRNGTFVNGVPIDGETALSPGDELRAGAVRIAVLAGPRAAERRRIGRFLGLCAPYLRPHLRRLLEMVALMVLGLAFMVAFPFAFERLLDDAIPGGRMRDVVLILGVLGAALAVSLVAGLRRAYLGAYVGSAVVREVRAAIFARLQRLSARWFAARQQGDVVSRLSTDVMVVEQALAQTLQEGAFQVISLAVFAAVLLVLDPVLGGIVLAGVPLVAVVYRLMGAGAQRRSAAVQEEIGGVLAVAAENYEAQPVVRAFGLAERECRRFAGALGRLFSRQVSLQLYGGMWSLSVNLIVTALRIAVLGAGALLIVRDELTIGALVAFIAVMGEVITPVTVLTDLGQQMQAATGALTRIEEVLDAEPDVADSDRARPLPALRGDVELSGVSFAYQPQRPALAEVDVRIPAGSRVAFVGPTGAGKSSLLALLLRFYDPDRGAVRVDGHDVRDVTVDSLRSQIGVVFQDTFLFDGTVGENIAVGRPGASAEEIEAAARAAELHGVVQALPQGYDTPVGERGAQLSGGQRQRLAIARALLRDPALLLLDEATSALDPRTERLIADTLDRVAGGRTTIAVTHRLASIAGYDHIFVLVDGRIVEHGRHPELVRAGGAYAELWAEQHRHAPLDEALAPAPRDQELAGV